MKLSKINILRKSTEGLEKARLDNVEYDKLF